MVTLLLIANSCGLIYLLLALGHLTKAMPSHMVLLVIGLPIANVIILGSLLLAVSTMPLILTLP